MRANKLLFGLIILSAFCLPVSADEICSKNVENLRSDALTALYRLEESYRDAGWNYKKYQEMVYNQLWNAVIKRKDAYSEVKKTEGEVLYQRYRLASDQRLRRAENDLEAAFRELETVKKGLVKEDSCGGALQSEKPGDNISQFNNCMEIWDHETGDLLKDLEKLLKRYEKKQADFSEMIEAHLTDNPSNHDTFEDRYHDFFYEFDFKTQAVFLKLVRNIQERFEWNWPAEECCAVCQADQRSRWDPVLSQVKPDPQGDSGVGGNLVNNARLKLAFEKFEKDKKEETAKS